MTAVRRVTVQCDGCETVYELQAETLPEVRRSARKDGWGWDRHNGIDICPECSTDPRIRFATARPTPRLR